MGGIIEKWGFAMHCPFFIEKKTKNNELRKIGEKWPLKPLKLRKYKARLKAFKWRLNYLEDPEASFPLKQYAQTTTQDIIALGREKEIADLALNDASYWYLQWCINGENHE